MGLNRLIALVIVFAAGVTAPPAFAQLYKWVDERGATHYSDRRPADPKAAERIDPVAPRVSVYSPDKALLQEVEALRLKRSQPEAPTDLHRLPAPYAAAMDAPPPVAYGPCVPGDCAGVSGVLYPYPTTVFVPVRRRPQHLMQAVLPAGAIAGTINSNGAIPGNSAGINPVIPDSHKPGPRMRPLNSRSPLEAPLPRR